MLYYDVLLSPTQIYDLISEALSPTMPTPVLPLKTYQPSTFFQSEDSLRITLPFIYREHPDIQVLLGPTTGVDMQSRFLQLRRISILLLYGSILIEFRIGCNLHVKQSGSPEVSPKAYFGGDVPLIRDPPRIQTLSIDSGQTEATAESPLFVSDILQL